MSIDDRITLAIAEAIVQGRAFTLLFFSDGTPTHSYEGGKA